METKTYMLFLLLWSYFDAHCKTNIFQQCWITLPEIFLHTWCYGLLKLDRVASLIANSSRCKSVKQIKCIDAQVLAQRCLKMSKIQLVQVVQQTVYLRGQRVLPCPRRVSDGSRIYEGPGKRGGGEGVTCFITK